MDCAPPGPSRLFRGWRIRADGFCRHVCALRSVPSHYLVHGQDRSVIPEIEPPRRGGTTASRRCASASLVSCLGFNTRTPRPSWAAHNPAKTAGTYAPPAASSQGTRSGDLQPPPLGVGESQSNGEGYLSQSPPQTLLGGTARKIPERFPQKIRRREIIRTFLSLSSQYIRTNGATILRKIP